MTKFDYQKVEWLYNELKSDHVYEEEKSIFDEIATTAKVGYWQPNDENGVLGEEYKSEDSEGNLITCLVFPKKIAYQRTAQVGGHPMKFTLVDTWAEIKIS